MLREANGHFKHLIKIQVNHILPEALNATISMEGKAEKKVELKVDFNEFEYWVPAVSRELKISIKLNVPSIFVSTKSVTLQPVVTE